MIPDIFEIPPEVPGAAQLAAIFGSRHTFHDAEVLSVTLRVPDVAEIKVLTFRMTGEVDSQGYYVLADRTFVTFQFREVTEYAVDGFSRQNVVSSLEVERTPAGHRLTIYASLGFAGSIDARQVAITVEPCDSGF